MKRLLGLIVVMLVCAGFVFAQNSTFGKNKVQYKRFDWQFIQTDHFDVYFAQNGYELAQFAADAAEDAYQSIKKLMRYEITNRISLVVHNSHNEFQQTNVISEYLDEGIGGVTELFKNRIVLPFEGNYQQYRHVVHHELVHAVINDMFYGGTIQSLISSRSPLQLPLWMNEGFAEYAALKWDPNSDMFIRDAAIHNYLPPIEFLSGYFAYRGGQSVWNYIATKYGEPKIAEILSRIRGTRSIDQGFKSTIGLTVKELSERWEKEQKVVYWPDIAKREEPTDFSQKRLTNHTKDGNFYNTSPAISPQGDKVAFISDRNDYLDVYLLSTVDGSIIKRVVSGQRNRDFEELHLLTPGITWSPDGKKIALATKSGEFDAIMIVDIESEDVEKIPFSLDGIFSVDWSPDGTRLVFVGNKAPQSDVYVYDLKMKELTNLTNDIFSDYDPSFGPDSKSVYFSSDRKDFVSPSMLPKNFRMSRFDFKQRSLYSIDIQTKQITRITSNGRGDDSSPLASSDGKKVIYISDRNGINNMYVKNLATGEDYPITNSLSGVYQLTLTRDGSKLAFTSLNEAGFDVYVLLRPFEKKLNVKELELTEFFKKRFSVPTDEKPKELRQTEASSDTVAIRNNVVILADSTDLDLKYKNDSKVSLGDYVFSEENVRADTMYNQSVPRERFESVANQDTEGNFIPRKYKLNFTPDLVYGAANYNTFYGLEGSTLFAFSDMMGDHQIIFQTNLLLDLRNSDYGLSYYYLPGRIDFGFQGFHSARFLYLGNPAVLFRFRMWGLGASASYPIDRYNRIDFSLMWLNLSKDNLDNGAAPSQKRSFLMPTLSFVRDNSLWQGAWFAPSNGSRFNFTFYGSPKISAQALDLQTFTLDYRNYTKVARELVFAARVAGGISLGADRQNFFIGGTEGWINRQFDKNNGSIPINNVEDYAFLTPVMPLRGYNYNVQNGTKFLMTNLEWRFPLIRYFILGALPIGFQNILGAAFVDMGSAWTNDNTWKAFGQDASGATVTRDLLIGTGFGARLQFFGMPLRIDLAWQFNWAGFSEPIYLFSLGAEY
jgi:hypothetical protein